MPHDEELLRRAREALQNAYAPYSRYRVGACILAADGRMFCGCNVENASYGLTICAERGAVMAAVASGARAFERIAIVSEGSLPWPCGACRQVLREFAPDIEVLVQDGGGNTRHATLSELLPMSFGPESL
ncbi:MAG: cytidine deaminase [Candidatus Fimadaptatus sp.]